ncbi:CvpA family protein [Helicobacter pylori]|uniref:CvpA family protein n=1 Tax=Helicobacter pylori TaxID=210 RepID=UPI0019242952|nr:CvpA family protein [Helicobacter pylori]QQW77316.1 CvpA family protein [Helicobacter pylori]WRA97035.1 CvpA family protein [Helicobacter pylori]
MNYIDLALLVVVVAFGIRGFYHGFVSEVAGTLGIVLGVYLASRYSVAVGNLFSEHLYDLRNETMTNLIGFLLVLASIWVFFLAFGVLLGKVLVFSGLGIIDKALGFIFSCLKTFLVLSFILYALSKMEVMKDANAYLQEKSAFFSTMKSIASKIMRLDGVKHVEKNLKDNLEEMSDEVKNKNKESIDNAKESFDKATDKGVEALKEKAKDLPKNMLEPKHNKPNQTPPIPTPSNKESL